LSPLNSIGTAALSDEARKREDEEEDDEDEADEREEGEDVPIRHVRNVEARMWWCEGPMLE
jgi:hypothetical protein